MCARGRPSVGQDVLPADRAGIRRPGVHLPVHCVPADCSHGTSQPWTSHANGRLAQGGEEQRKGAVTPPLLLFAPLLSPRRLAQHSRAHTRCSLFRSVHPTLATHPPQVLISTLLYRFAFTAWGYALVVSGCLLCVFVVQAHAYARTLNYTFYDGGFWRWAERDPTKPHAGVFGEISYRPLIEDFESRYPRPDHILLHMAHTSGFYANMFIRQVANWGNVAGAPPLLFSCLFRDCRFTRVPRPQDSFFTPRAAATLSKPRQKPLVVASVLQKRSSAAAHETHRCFRALTKRLKSTRKPRRPPSRRAPRTRWVRRATFAWTTARRRASCARAHAVGRRASATCRVWFGRRRSRCSKVWRMGRDALPCIG